MWLTVAPRRDEILEQYGAFPATRGAVLRSVAGDAADTRLTDLFARGLASMMLHDPRELTPEEANRIYGIEGALSFDQPVSEMRASELYEFKRMELLRRDILERGPRGLVGELGVGIAASLLDPLAVGASFVPGAAPALRTSALGVRSGVAYNAQRALQGGAYGALGALAVEAGIYPLARFREQRDYTMADSLLNIAFGGGLGAAGGSLGAYLDQRRVRRMIEDNAPIPAMASADLDVIQAAHAAAVAQAAEGRPVRVAEIFEQDPAPDAPRGLNGYDLREGRDVTVIAPGGGRAPARYAVTDIRGLITSHDDGLQANPDFPQVLQPRDRARADLNLQVGEIARKLDPERLGETFDAGTGAPLIGRDGIVESGNGRTMALRRAYREDGAQADAYRQFLRERGYDIDGIEQPVLVRVRADEPDLDARAQFARDANTRTTAAMSPSEQSLADAAQLTPELIDLYAGGGAELAQNQGFVARFIERIAGAEDRGALIDADGQLSPDGMRRVNQALVAYAYDDLELITRMAETSEAGERTLGNALRMAAPEWAAMRARIEAGDIAADADPTPHLIEAIKLVRRIRFARQAMASVDEGAARMRGDSDLKTGAENLQAAREAARAAYGGYVDMLEAAGRLVFAGKPSQFFKSVSAGSQIDLYMEGAYLRNTGRVVVFADNAPPERIGPVILHEFGVHSGMQGMLGKSNFHKMLAEVEKRVRAGDEAFVEARRRAQDDALSPEHIAEETLAYLVESVPEAPFVQRIIAQIKAAVLRRFPELATKMRLDDQTLHQLAVLSLRREARQGKAAKPRDWVFWQPQDGPMRVEPADQYMASMKEAPIGDGVARSVLDQRDVFGGEVSLEAEAFVRLLYRDAELTKLRSQKKIAELLQSIAKDIREGSEIDLLGTENAAKTTLTRIADSADALARVYGPVAGDDFGAAAAQIRARQASRSAEAERAGRAPDRSDRAPEAVDNGPAAVGHMLDRFEQADRLEARVPEGAGPDEGRPELAPAAADELQAIEDEIAQLEALVGEESAGSGRMQAVNDALFDARKPSEFDRALKDLQAAVSGQAISHEQLLDIVRRYAGKSGIDQMSDDELLAKLKFSFEEQALGQSFNVEQSKVIPDEMLQAADGQSSDIETQTEFYRAAAFCLKHNGGL